MPSSSAAREKFSCRPAASNARIAVRGGSRDMPIPISQTYAIPQAFCWRWSVAEGIWGAPDERTQAMTDEHLMRQWADAHSDFTSDLDRGLLRLGRFVNAR